MKECDKEHLINDMWEYIEQHVAPMLKKLKLYDSEVTDSLPATHEAEDMINVFAEKVLKCIEEAQLNTIQVRSITAYKYKPG